MIKVIIALVVVLILAFAGGMLYLAYGNFPVSSQPVQRVLPDARFPK